MPLILKETSKRHFQIAFIKQLLNPLNGKAIILLFKNFSGTFSCIYFSFGKVNGVLNIEVFVYVCLLNYREFALRTVKNG